MWLLYADETNLDPKHEWFVYGGIAIPGDRAGALKGAITELRTKLKVPREHLLKFNPGPEGMSHEDFKLLKGGLLEVAAAHGAHLLVYIVSHKIVARGDVQAARRMAINTLAYHFDCLMHREDSHGLVLLDRFNDKDLDALLREKHAMGLKGLPYSKEYELKKIVGLHLTAIGQSHFCSVVDVALGSLRFAINAFVTKHEKQVESAAALLRLLSPLMYRDSAAPAVHEIGFCLAPKSVKSDAYRAEYVALANFFGAHGLELAQAKSGWA